MANLITIPIQSGYDVHLPGQALTATNLIVTSALFAGSSAMVTYQYQDNFGNVMYSNAIPFTFTQLVGAGANFLSLNNALTALLVNALSAAYTSGI